MYQLGLQVTLALMLPQVGEKKHRFATGVTVAYVKAYIDQVSA